MGKSKDLATGASYQDQNESDARYVNTVGDTVTGALYLNTTLGSRQLDITGVEADIWLNSTGPNKTWRILGSTGSNTHKLRFYDHSNAAERMAIDASGRVTMPYQPAFQAFNAQGQYITGVTEAAFGSTHSNVGNHYSTSTGRFTAPVSGNYFFHFDALADTLTGGHHFSLRKNGTELNGSEAYHNGTEFNIAKAMVYYLSAGDYVSVFLNTANSRIHQRYGSFCGHLVG